MNSCAAPGACVLAGVGTTDGTITTGHPVALLVRAVATGSATSGTIAAVVDENFGGTITSAGTWPYTAYTVDANGIGTVTGTGSPTIHVCGRRQVYGRERQRNYGRYHRPKHD